MTERLYYQDPYQRTFEARVVAYREENGQPAVTLSATAFYPTAGGQPHDTGTLDDARIVDVTVDEQGEVWHLLDRPLDRAEQETVVRGVIDSGDFVGFIPFPLR